MWKLHNEADPGFPQECVGDYDNVGGGNRAEEGSVGRVRANTHDFVIFQKRERSHEVSSYSDITR